MMFDWNEQDQAKDALWGGLGESEDRVVPHTRDMNILLAPGDCRKRKIDDDANSCMSTEQITEPRIEHSDYKLEEQSSSRRVAESPGSRIEMDTWPDLPNITAGLNNGYSEENDLDSLARELMNDLSDAPDLSSVAVQLDGEPELTSNEQEDKESGIFLDCDWANIEDFSDLDRYFRNNDSVFGHEIFETADEYLSSSADVISSATQSIPMPEVPICNEHSDQGFSFSRLNELSDGSRSSLKKEKVDGPNRYSRSQKKIDTNSRDKCLQNKIRNLGHKLNQKQVSSQSFDTSVETVLPPFQSVPMCHFGIPNQVVCTALPTYPFPAILHVNSERNTRPLPNPNHSSTVEKSSDVFSRSVTMTPQEKIEKLRRRQQRQAMLAIQHQQQHYSHQIASTNDSTSQACNHDGRSQGAPRSTVEIEECSKNLPHDGLLQEQDKTSVVPMSIDDKSMEETIYHQLQETLGKLDIRVRLCIRDSLHRLAKNAIERQSINDGSSTNRSNKNEDEFIADGETNIRERTASFADSETYTNPIDRVVAHLLFHRPSESFSPLAKIQSPIM